MRTARAAIRLPVAVIVCCLLGILPASPAWAREGSAPVPVLEELRPEPDHSSVTAEILDRLTRSHYQSVILDDQVSGRVFESYIKALDPSRRYFLTADIAEFEPLRTRFDDLIEEGDLGPAFSIFNRYRQRLDERLRFLAGVLDEGFVSLDFGKQESLQRTHAAWASSTEELRNRWRRQLKGDVLNRLLAGAEREEIRTELRRRYRNQRRRLAKDNNADVFQVYTNSFLRVIDPHTAYFPPHQSENFDIHTRLSLEGIGAVLQDDGGAVKVVRLVPGGPADKAGALRPGDHIVGVAQGEDGEMVDILGMRLDEVVTLIRGPRETTVRLEIIPRASVHGERTVVRIVRNKVDLKDQEASSRVREVDAGERTDRVGVIRLPMFYLDFAAKRAGDPDYKSSAADVQRLITELRAAGVGGLVVDLRDNGGGALSEAIRLVGLFIRTGPVVQIRDGRGVISVRSDKDPDVAYDGPMAVLVNRFSASASEIFTGAVQDYGRGLVLGVQTFGKGTVQTMMPVSKGHLKLTQAMFYRVSGESTQHRGVVPDIEFPDLIDKTEAGESALDHALAWNVIDPARYARTGDPAPFLAELRRRHRERAQSDPDFIHLRSRIERLRKQRAETAVSLSEETRRNRKMVDEIGELDSENNRRVAKGEKPFGSYAELVAHYEGKAASGEAPEDDPILEETVRILADFIGLSRSASQVRRRGT